MVSQRKSTKKAKHHKVILWIIVIFLLLVAIFLLAPLVQSFSLKSTLNSESKRALTENRSRINESTDGYFNSLTQQLGIDTAPIYAISYKSCYTDHNDSGWVANSYNYKCTVTDFAFYPIPENSQLKNAIDTHGEPAVKGSKSEYSYQYGSLYRYLPSMSDAYSGIKDMPFSIDVIKNNTYTDVKDVLTLEALNFSPDVVTYASDDEKSNREVLKEVGVKVLDTDKTYIVLKQGNQYYSKNIGCKIPKLIFCNSPV